MKAAERPARESDLGAGMAMAQQMMGAMRPPAPAPPAAPEAAPAGARGGRQRTKFCISCGKPIPRAAHFCSECGGAQQ